MGLQQLGFDFFDEEPRKENKAPDKAWAVPPSTNVENPAPNLDTIVAREDLLITVEEEVRDLAFMAEEEHVNIANKKTVKIINPIAKKNTRGRMKLSDMDEMVHMVEVPEDDVLFQKRYYNIGAVSDMFKVNVSLIRFWENEFDILKPKKNGKGDRLFRPEDIKNLQ
ncbi:MAG: MerR family transcriptional regulator, partial [Ferruginibacter sp.]